MAIVPDDRLGKLEFYESHLTPWGASATAIGLTSAKVTALATKVEDCRKAYSAQQDAQNAAKAATQAFYDSVRDMHNAPGMGADMIETIKTFARTSDNPAVYTLAQIPPPQAPGTVPPPGTPFDFKLGLLQDGSLELTWKCDNPPGSVGTIYEVRRKATGAASPWIFVGATGIKEFVDDALPTTGSPWTYQITAVRSTARGNPAEVTVKFGVPGAGGAGFSFTTIADDEDGGQITGLAA